MKPKTNFGAFTLIEVVAGLILMGSLAASTLVALAAQQRSILLAKQKQKATQVAEGLLTRWYDLVGEVPTRNQGIVAAEETWLWRTQPVGFRNLCGLPVNIIRLDIIGTLGTNAEPRVLASVELVQKQTESVMP